MNKNQKIIDSFSLRDELNPKIWDSSSKENKMKSNVRKALLKISEEFIDFLGDDVFVEDIVLMGSLSNYNWSEYSDFDLHVMIDFSQYEKQSELYKELFDLKKQVFNDKHNIKIFGYDVELYAQDSEESYYSSGVYSIMDDEWVSKPEKVKFNLDKDVLKSKIKCWTNKIESSIDDAKKSNDVKKLKSLKEKLKTYRKSGLKKEGELSYENLTFKYLRRSGHIGDLMDSLNQIRDKELSIETKKLDEALSDYNFVEKRPGIIDSLDDGFASIVEPFIQELDSIGCSVGRYTSGRRPPLKNKNSKHITGQALDMTFEQDSCYCKAMDICVKYPELFCLDERKKITIDWSGAHMHVSVAQNKGKTKPCGSGDYSQSDFSSDTISSNIQKFADNNKTFKLEKGRIKFNPDVKVLQTALQSIGFLFSNHGIDGKFGEETKQRIMDFQSTFGLPETGVMGKKDLEKLASALYFEKLDLN